MKKLWKRSVLLCVSLLFLAVFVTQNAHAVPAFGRAMGGVSCNACHATPTWQLNQTGLEFLRSGHRTDHKEFKADEVKWDNYLSLVWKFRAYNTDKPAANAGGKSQFEQHSFSIYTGGALSDRFSYFTEMYLSENSSNTATASQGDSARKKLAEAFLQYNLPIGEHNFVAFRAGEILPEIVHTFGVGARSIEQRAEIHNTGTNSANPYKPFFRSQGFDAKYNSEYVEATVGVVNGAATNTNHIDSNNHKDLYAALQGNVDKNGSAVGLFRYEGVHTTYATADNSSTAATFNNEFNKTLLLARYVHDKFRLTGAYLNGEEEENISSVKTKTKNKGYFGVVDFNFTDSLGVAARYDFLDPRKDTSFSETKVMTLSVNGMFYQHEKSGARWALDYSDKEVSATSATTSKTETKKIQAQLTWAI
ncbi:MAG: hypothetical protein HYV97_19450 [Bdellovibrio sp.]|nr:hypothetical protein [Bdellovibrio sp.]